MLSTLTSTSAPTSGGSPFSLGLTSARVVVQHFDIAAVADGVIARSNMIGKSHFGP